MKLPTLTILAVLCTLEVGANALPDRAQDPQHPDWPEALISAELRRERAGRIRDTAAAAGMTNGVLLAGIGQVETGFAHCWSEAQWACQGPASSSCNGGAVIAGSADGPCSAQQGGLGMFQFDAGTFTDTINTYGANIVTMEGNVEAVVPFLVTRAIQSVEGVNNEQEALDWMNSIPIVAGDPLFESWIYFVTWRYNGCKGCTTQMGKYRDGTLLLQDEMGADFWVISSEDSCGMIPGEGRVIEEDDDCFDKRGPLQYWRSENAGHGGAMLWTKATDSATTSNYALWRLRFETDGDYELFAYSDGGEFGQSVQAGYEIGHADGSTVVSLDQSSADGWRSLGVFRFEAAIEGQQIRLDDNTGEAWAADPGGIKLLYDAIQVEPVGSDGPGDPNDPDDPDDPDDPNDPSATDDDGALLGVCALAPQGPIGTWPLLLVLLALYRRRRGSQH